MSVWKLYRGKIALVIFVIIGAIFIGLAVNTSRMQQIELERVQQQENDFRQIVDTCSNRQYEQAIQMTENLQEPYKNYYMDYITYAMELDGWVGTEQELYTWLEDYMEFYKESSYGDMSFSDSMSADVQVWNVVNEVKQKFDEDKSFISEAFLWQPEFNQILCDYYTEIYEIMWQNREFFRGEVVDGLVAIPVSSIVRLDERAFELYQNSSIELKQLQTKYNLNDDYETLFLDELYRMQEVYNSYSENAISSMLDESYREKINIYFSADGAEKNYKALSNNYKLTGFYLSSEEHERVWICVSSDNELPAFVDDISAAAFDLYVMVKDIYPSVEFEIVESNLVDDAAIYDEIFSDNY